MLSPPSQGTGGLGDSRAAPPLPLELWHTIFESIPFEQLVHLCLTNSTFHSLAAPQLYYRSFHNIPRPQVDRLSRTLPQNRQLAMLVREFNDFRVSHE